MTRLSGSALMVLLVTSFAHAGKNGHYVFVPSDKWDCAFYEWIPPDDCNTWPKDMVWAGGIVYDHRGCQYPKIDGKCDADIRATVPDCSERPPAKPPRIKDRDCPKRTRP